MKLTLLLLAFSTFAQPNANNCSDGADGSGFYLITRGTTGKNASIAREFNRSDRFATHVGIGIREQGTLQVYHVTNETQGTALVKSSLQEFVGVADIFYWAMWRYDSDADQSERLRQILTHWEQPIAFDFDFDAADDDKLYCSEFCVKALQRLDPTVFRFGIATKMLDPLYAMLLECVDLKYWPVDFFEEDARFEKISETFIETPPER